MMYNIYIFIYILKNRTNIIALIFSRYDKGNKNLLRFFK